MTAAAFFLALAVWKEASNQSSAAMLAVAYSILRRASLPRWWGTDIQSVIFKPYQYSSFTVKGDPDLIRWPQSNDPSWVRSIQAAQAAMMNSAPNPAPKADSYYDISIAAPVWATPEGFIVQIDRLRFYETV